MPSIGAYLLPALCWFPRKVFVKRSSRLPEKSGTSPPLPRAGLIGENTKTEARAKNIGSNVVGGLGKRRLSLQRLNKVPVVLRLAYAVSARFATPHANSLAFPPRDGRRTWTWGSKHSRPGYLLKHLGLFIPFCASPPTQREWRCRPAPLTSIPNTMEAYRNTGYEVIRYEKTFLLTHEYRIQMAGPLTMKAHGLSTRDSIVSPTLLAAGYPPSAYPITLQSERLLRLRWMPCGPHRQRGFRSDRVNVLLLFPGTSTFPAIWPLGTATNGTSRTIEKPQPYSSLSLILKMRRSGNRRSILPPSFRLPAMQGLSPLSQANHGGCCR